MVCENLIDTKQWNGETKYWRNMKNLQYLMDSTCTNTALIKCHLSYHSQAGI